MCATVRAAASKGAARRAGQGNQEQGEETILASSRGSVAPRSVEAKGSLAAKLFAPDERESFAPVFDKPPIQVCQGGAGDHGAVHQLLTAIFQGPSRDAFSSSLDDPLYEPRDRMVVRQAGRVVSHVQLVDRVMRFGSLEIPVCRVHSLGTLPEHRGHGYGRELLRQADEQMRAEGAVLGMLSTKIPQFFGPSGWVICGRQSRARANTRELLAELSSRGVPPAEEPLTIRPWRQVELPSLMKMYADRIADAAGPLVRTEAYWRWLISRQGFDQIFVAIDGPDRFDLEHPDVPIAGYVVTKDDRVLELMADPHIARPRQRNTVAEQLLARACGEAIERDYHSIQLHAGPTDSLLELFRNSGGTVYHDELPPSEVCMVRLFDPLGFLRMLAPELQRRAEAANLTGKTELGLAVGEEKYLLSVSRRGVKLAPNKLGRSYLRASQPEFTRLLLGHFDAADAVAQDRLVASTRLAIDTARILFPKMPLWRAPWDELYL